MTAKLIVGFKTRTVPGFEALMPEFKAPSNWKDPAKIAADIEAKKAAFAENAKDAPYTGTFDEVFIVDPRHEQVKPYQYREPGSGRQPVALAVRSYLMKYWKDAWSDDTHSQGPPKVVFIGFAPKLFLKMLGLECSMPAVNKPLPVRLWYDNQTHRDITEAVLPKEFQGLLTMAEVVKARRPLDEASAEKWDKMTAGWTGPGNNAEQDARIAAELATQLGFLKG